MIPMFASRSRQLAALGALVLALILVAVPAGHAEGSLVSYDIGGFAPPMQLQITRTGRCTLQYSLADTTTRRFVLTRRRLAELKSALEAARWSSLRRTYASPTSPGGETVFSSVTYAGRTVTVNSPARVPQRLSRVFRMLRTIIWAHL